MNDVGGRGRREVAIDFSVDEVVALCRFLGVPDLVVTRPSPWEGLAEDVSGRVYEATVRALAARRVLIPGGSDGELACNRSVDALIRLAAQPNLLLHMVREDAGYVQTRFLSTTPLLSVEMIRLEGDLARLHPFATEDLLSVIEVFVCLTDRPVLQGEAGEVAMHTLTTAGEKVAEGDQAAAVAVLTLGGLQEGTATEFVKALADKTGSAQVSSVFRPDETQVEAGTVTWLDSESGLWVTDTPDSSDPDFDQASVTIKPTSADEVRESILGLFPKELRESVAPQG